jgi:hypothetical protein
MLKKELEKFLETYSSQAIVNEKTFDSKKVRTIQHS